MSNIEGLEPRVMFADTRPYGIDVSHWQGSINWSNVAGAAGKVFAWTKATEGVTYTDPTVGTNAPGAKNAGLFAGVYHFARPENNPAAAEAQHFLDVARQYMTWGYLRPALDLESGSTLSTAALSQWVTDFENYVKRATGLAPVIYIGRYAREGEVNSTVTSFPMWVAHWTYDPVNTQPNIGIWPTYAFWQYADNGTVAGVSGACDLDVFNGTLAQLTSTYVTPRTVVTGSTFVFDSASAPQTLRFTFNLNVSASLSPADLTLVNTTTGMTIPTANVAVSYDDTMQRASFTFPGFAHGILPDGNYTATLSAAGVKDFAGTAMAANFSRDFFVLAGDANHDRAVDTLDFNTLAANFGKAGQTFSTGDFTYDGVVDTLDFNALAANFGHTLAAPASGLTTPQPPIAPSQPSAHSIFSELWILETRSGSLLDELR